MTEPRSYPFGDQTSLEPHEIYRRLRAEEPVSRVKLRYGEPAWLITRYADVRTVLADPRFSRAEALRHDPPRTSEWTETAGIQTLDAPQHTRLRRLIVRAFTTHRVERLRPIVERIAGELVDTMIAGGAPADFIARAAEPLSIRSVCALLGVPDADEEIIRAASDAIESTSSQTPEQAGRAIAALREYVLATVRHRRAIPGDDLISALASQTRGEDRLTEDELLTLVFGLLVAGFETTSTQLGNVLLVVLRNPDLAAGLRADPGRIPAAVDELNRYIPLVGAGVFPRYATEDVEIAGVTIRAGEAVVCDTNSANRDETAFAEPDRIDPARDPAHLAFGYGAHRCLGAPLGRLEIITMLGRMLGRLPELRLADGSAVAWKPGTVVRGPRELWLRW